MLVGHLAKQYTIGERLAIYLSCCALQLSFKLLESGQPCV